MGLVRTWSSSLALSGWGTMQTLLFQFQPLSKPRRGWTGVCRSASGFMTPWSCTCLLSLSACGPFSMLMSIFPLTRLGLSSRRPFHQVNARRRGCVHVCDQIVVPLASAVPQPLAPRRPWSPDVQRSPHMPLPALAPRLPPLVVMPTSGASILSIPLGGVGAGTTCEIPSLMSSACKSIGGDLRQSVMRLRRPHVQIAGPCHWGAPPMVLEAGPLLALRLEDVLILGLGRLQYP